MRSAALVFVIAALVAAAGWAAGVGRHSVTLEIVPASNEAGEARVFAVSAVGVYSAGEREFRRDVFGGPVAANTPLRLRLPPQSPFSFKRLEVRVLHPAFRPYGMIVEHNPHWWRRELAPVTPGAWLSEGREPVDARLMSDYVAALESEFLPLVGAGVAEVELWHARDALQTLLPRIDYRALHDLSADDRSRHRQDVQAALARLMRLASPPDAQRGFQESQGGR